MINEESRPLCRFLIFLGLLMIAIGLWIWRTTWGPAVATIGGGTDGPSTPSGTTVLDPPGTVTVPPAVVDDPATVDDGGVFIAPIPPERPGKGSGTDA